MCITPIGGDITGQVGRVAVTVFEIQPVSTGPCGTDITNLGHVVTNSTAVECNPNNSSSWFDVSRQVVSNPRGANGTTISIRSVYTVSGIAHIR